MSTRLSRCSMPHVVGPHNHIQVHLLSRTCQIPSSQEHIAPDENSLGKMGKNEVVRFGSCYYLVHVILCHFGGRPSACGEDQSINNLWPGGMMPSDEGRTAFLLYSPRSRTDFNEYQDIHVERRYSTKST